MSGYLKHFFNDRLFLRHKTLDRCGGYVVVVLILVRF